MVRYEEQVRAEDPENACTAEPLLAPDRIVGTWHPKRPSATVASPASSLHAPKRSGCFTWLHGVSVRSSRHDNGH